MPRKRQAPNKPGLVPVMRGVSARGLRAIDGRSVAFRAVKVWRNEIVAALGGEENISAQRKTLLEIAACTRLYLNHVDSYLLELSTLINRRKKSLIPIVEQRQRLADSLMRQLQVLGLDRVAAEATLPAEWITKVRPYDHEHEASPEKSSTSVSKDDAKEV